jgi:hypothetical protein
MYATPRAAGSAAVDSMIADDQAFQAHVAGLADVVRDRTAGLPFWGGCGAGLCAVQKGTCGNHMTDQSTCPKVLNWNKIESHIRACPTKVESGFGERQAEKKELEPV